MLQEADYGTTAQAMLPPASSVEGIDPRRFENLLVRFVMHPHKDRQATEKEGRPIFKEIPYVDIRVPGDRINHQFRPATDVDQAKWPRHWEAFRNRISQTVAEGTPLEEWPAIPRSKVEELKFFNVITIEQLAHMNDAHVQKFMGLREWVEKALAWLATNEKSEEAAKLASELKQRDDKIDQLQTLVEGLQAKIESLESDGK